MSNHGSFAIEEGDIVKLESGRDGERACMGWVNVGTHAVQLTMGEDGELTVDVCARTNEGVPVGKVVVSKAQSVAAGGEDPSADEDEPAPLTGIGKIWWSADNLVEAQAWQRDLTARGAQVELRPEVDRAIFDVIITLERARANEILGYEVGSEEWLEEDEPVPASLVPEVNEQVANIQPRVLVVVSGGVAHTIQDDGVDVEVFDWDNHEDNPLGSDGVPARFADLARAPGIPVADYSEAESIALAGTVKSLEDAPNWQSDLTSHTILTTFNALVANESKQVGVGYTFCQVAKEMLAAARGDISAVDAGAFYNEVITRSIVQNKQSPASVQTLLLEVNPGAMTQELRQSIEAAVRNATQQLQAGVSVPDMKLGSVERY